MPKGIYTRPARLAIIPIGPSIAYVPLTKGYFALIDSQDAASVEKSKWSVRWDDHSQCFYARRNAPSSKGRGWESEALHQFIIGKKEGHEIDHIQPGNGLDCRRCNLRHATRNQQQRNKRVPQNNRSGVKGISRYLKRGKSIRYRVRIMADGRSIFLGDTARIEDAIAMRDAGIKKYHGAFGRKE